MDTPTPLAAAAHPDLDLPVRLVLAFTTVTAAAGLYALAGWQISVAVLLVGVLAIAAGHRTGPPTADSALPPYILTVALTLAADTLRYQFSYSGLLGAAMGGPLADLSQRWWFVGFVVAPVSVMLFGGYVLGRQFPGAALAAWWTVLFAALDGVSFLIVLAARHPSSPGFAAGAVAVTAAQLLLATVLAQRLLAGGPVPKPAEHKPALTLRQRNLWTALIVAAVALYALAIETTAGWLPVGVIVGSMMGGMVGWRRTTARRPADPRFHVPLLLLMLTLFYVHVGEEAITSFNRGIAAITSTPWSESSFTTVFGLAGPIVWAFAAWSLWRRQPLGNFIYWFLLVGMILGEPTHVVLFPVMRMIQVGGGYGYFSGMYTALFPMIPAILAVRALRRTHLLAPGARGGTQERAQGAERQPAAAGAGLGGAA